MRFAAWAALIALVAYLLLWPVPVEPVAWKAPAAPGYVGPLAPNTRLAQFEALTLDGLHGPEAVVVGVDGTLYASTHEGWILRAGVNDTALQRWVNAGGRPLGLALDAEGNLWVANAYIGLQKITPQGTVSTELSHVEGSAIRYADDLDITTDGTIYLSDASTRFAAQDWAGTLSASLLDLNEHSRSGRIIEYHPKRGARILLEGFSFANGVALDPQGRYLLIAETGEYRVWKHWLRGPATGKSEVIIDQLPGFPDNVHLGQNGRYWVGLTSPRSPIIDGLAEWPFVRKIIQRLPDFLRPNVVHYGMVLAVDENGSVLENLQAPAGEVYATTGVAETDDYLYVTSLTMPVLARYQKAALAID
ncbi:MAG: strictosidine synthase family protein [Gammaproteobacteria bacterium]|nr:strictosidine synthase family protein [Gammaproteobacteria bacterium]